MAPYPAEELAAHLRRAGWTGTAKAGWLFWAHSAAEAGHGAGPVLDELRRRLGVDDSPELIEAAELVAGWVGETGAVPRKLITMMEGLVTHRVANDRPFGTVDLRSPAHDRIERHVTPEQ